jgi:hypothetical protein
MPFAESQSAKSLSAEPPFVDSSSVVPARIVS